MSEYFQEYSIFNHNQGYIGPPSSDYDQDYIDLPIMKSA